MFTKKEKQVIPGLFIKNCLEDQTPVHLHNFTTNVSLSQKKKTLRIKREKVYHNIIHIHKT